jgi:hypothetical protein
MEIKKEHKALLKILGLKEEDFGLFDDKFVRYEYDEGKGVRLYDPYYETSYNEYIDSDGWSAWSGENDTFMSDILKASHKNVPQSKTGPTKAVQDEITKALQKKFGKKTEPDSK